MMRGGVVEFTTDARADKVPVEQDFVRLAEPVHGAVVSEVFSDFGFAFDSHFLLIIGNRGSRRCCCDGALFMMLLVRKKVRSLKQ